jgi:hypothetical protein
MGFYTHSNYLNKWDEITWKLRIEFLLTRRDDIDDEVMWRRDVRKKQEI